MGGLTLNTKTTNQILTLLAPLSEFIIRNRSCLVRGPILTLGGNDSGFGGGGGGGGGATIDTFEFGEIFLGLVDIFKSEFNGSPNGRVDNGPDCSSVAATD